LYAAGTAWTRLCRVGHRGGGRTHLRGRQDRGLSLHRSAQSICESLLCQDRIRAGVSLLALSESPRRGLATARAAMDRFYEDAASLFVRAYDAFYVGGAPIAGDVAFYDRLARETGGPVLELACGTGRIALALAEKGLDITGVDISDGMLTVARRKAAGRTALVRDRLALINQDMSELDLGRRFGFAFVPARSFQHLLTIDRQRKSLQAIRRHLEPTGRLALHLFDPRLDLLSEPKTRV